MGCFDSTLKIVLFIFNFVFVICGIIIAAIGIVGVGWSNSVDGVLEDGTGSYAPAVVLVIIGVFIFILSFLGCCGALRESKCMLLTYAVFLLVIFIVQLVIGIYAVANFDEQAVKDSVNTYFDEVFNPTNPQEDGQQVFHDIEKLLQCCGGRGSYQYLQYHQDVPESCCPDTTCSSYYSDGCSTALADWISSAVDILGGVALGLCVVELVGAVLGFWLSRKSK